jgi:hypothetical protein
MFIVRMFLINNILKEKKNWKTTTKNENDKRQRSNFFVRIFLINQLCYNSERSREAAPLECDLRNFFNSKYNTIQYNTIQYNTIQYNTIQ